VRGEHKVTQDSCVDEFLRMGFAPLRFRGCLPRPFFQAESSQAGQGTGAVELSVETGRRGPHPRSVDSEERRRGKRLSLARRRRSDDVRDRLAELFVKRGVPQHIRSDTGPKFETKAVRHWLARVGVQTLCIRLGNSWENGSFESFNGTLRDERLDRGLFETLWEVTVLVERWMQTYWIRPHSALIQP